MFDRCVERARQHALRHGFAANFARIAHDMLAAAAPIGSYHMGIGAYTSRGSSSAPFIFHPAICEGAIPITEGRASL
jgi:hypothetical protein